MYFSKINSPDLSTEKSFAGFNTRRRGNGESLLFVKSSPLSVENNEKRNE